MVNGFPSRVMIFGTFDVFHPGHRYFIERAQAKCSELRTANCELIVVVARDVTVKKIKPLLRNAEQVRLKVLQEAFPELTIVLGDEKDPMKVLRDYRPEMVCLGYDQVGFSGELMKIFPEIRVERLEAFEPEKWKSSKMG
jgi:cytidyltransferase-like protein